MAAVSCDTGSSVDGRGDAVSLPLHTIVYGHDEVVATYAGFDMWVRNNEKHVP